MRRFTLAVLASLALSGCRTFVPSHPGLWVYGTVAQVGTGVPLVGAHVSVFGTTIKTGANGCFKLSLADALPFEFSVEDVGYKKVVSKPPRGFFRSTVALAQDGSDGVSAVSWSESNEQTFAAVPECH